MSDYNSIIGLILLGFFVIWALREFFAWYFKINARLNEQKKQTALLIQILEKNKL